MICTMKDVYSSIRRSEPKRVAVAQAADAHVLEALTEAFKEGFIFPILVGNEKKILEAAKNAHLDIEQFEIVHIEDDKDASLKAAELVALHQADVIMKGLMESADFLRAILNKEYGIREQDKVISTIAAVSLKKLNRFIFITDPGFTPLPDREMKVKLIENAVETAKKFEIEKPNVAMICAAESVNPKMISTIDAKEIEDMNKNGEITDCTVAGPISLDLALSAEAVRQKHYNNPVGGKADILVVPSLEVGNVLYKSLSLFSEIETGGIMTGTKVPVIFTSRADSAETKKNTLALAIFLAQKEEKK